VADHPFLMESRMLQSPETWSPERLAMDLLVEGVDPATELGNSL
jgi:hypothetical protein